MVKNLRYTADPKMMKKIGKRASAKKKSKSLSIKIDLFI